VAKRSPKKPAGKRPARTIAPKRKPARLRQHALATKPAELPVTVDPEHVCGIRELFWQNVIREILTSLSSVASLRPPEPEHPPALADMPAAGAPRQNGVETPGARIVSDEAAHAAAEAGGYQPELFDGRLAVVLRSGERVPIADVFPVFACAINTADRSLNAAVECTVFQIRTPQGQVFTVPLHEIRTFHALTPELIKRIASAARRQRRPAEVPEEMPFGFAAFTSLVRGVPAIVPEAPDHPTE
jgi:hypothetical protein